MQSCSEVINSNLIKHVSERFEVLNRSDRYLRYSGFSSLTSR